MRIGIVGFGNLGRALLRVGQEQGVNITAIVSRRCGKGLENSTRGVPLYHFDDVARLEGEVDVMLVAGGSATDLGWMSPELLEHFNIVDSFDTHSKIDEHLKRCDRVARMSGHLGILSVGWDPGLLSLFRLYARAVLPDSNITTVWGKGISQGHSDAIRRIDGVADAVQFTVPDEESVASVGKEGFFASPEALHIRECYVLPERGADLSLIEDRIKSMPSYFLGYRTVVHFVSEKELSSLRVKMSHRGRVIATGRTGGVGHRMDISLELGSNPDFTASVMLAYARAAFLLSSRGECGARTVYDIPPAMLMSGDNDYSLL